MNDTIISGAGYDALVRECDRLRARVAELEAENLRLTGWLAHIDGGDTPCLDEQQLRQWAYEALTLRRPAP